jgi:hypothetical protein
MPWKSSRSQKASQRNYALRRLCVEQLEPRGMMAGDIISLAVFDSLEAEPIDPTFWAAANGSEISASVDQQSAQILQADAAMGIAARDYRSQASPLETPVAAIETPSLDPQSAGRDVVYALIATDADGRRLTDLQPGQAFVLHVFVLDQRDAPHGVFAAYVNLHWDGGLAEATGAIQHSARYSNGISGDSSFLGEIREAGGFSGIQETGAGFHEVFRVPMRALAAGELRFDASSARVLPNNDTLLYGENSPIDGDRISYQGLVLNVGTPLVPEAAIETAPAVLNTNAIALHTSGSGLPSADLLALLAGDLASAALSKRSRG